LWIEVGQGLTFAAGPNGVVGTWDTAAGGGTRDSRCRFMRPGPTAGAGRSGAVWREPCDIASKVFAASRVASSLVVLVGVLDGRKEPISAVTIERERK